MSNTTRADVVKDRAFPLEVEDGFRSDNRLTTESVGSETSLNVHVPTKIGSQMSFSQSA